MKNFSKKEAQTLDQLPFYRSLLGKLSLLMLAISIIPILAVSLYSYITSSSSNIKRVKEEQQSQIKEKVSIIETWANQREVDMATLADTARVQTMDPVKATDALMQYFHLWGTFETIFIADETGMMTISSNEILADVSDRAYFKSAMLGNKAISEPLVSRLTGEVVIVFASPIISNENVVGVAGGSVTMENVEKLLNAGISGKTTDIYLTNPSGVIFTNPRFIIQIKLNSTSDATHLLNFKLDTQAGNAISKGQSGQQEYRNYIGQDVLGYYSIIPKLGWGIILEKQISEVQEKIRQQGLITLGIIVILTMLIGILGYLIAKSFTKPLKLIASAASQLAMGNINEKLVYSSQDEFGQLADSFRKMMDYQNDIVQNATEISIGNLEVDFKPKSDDDSMGLALQQMTQILKDTVGRINQTSKQLTDCSISLNTSARDAVDSTQQIAITIQQIAHGAAQQAESINKTASSIDQMSNAIEGIANGAQNQAEHVNRAASYTSKMTTALEQVSGNAEAVLKEALATGFIAEEGAASIKETLKGMNSIKEKVALTSAKVDDVSARSEDIGNIVVTIENISSQTNLLAINAAIEAAHAESQARAMSEYILDNLMVANARLIDKFIACQGDSVDNGYWVELANKVGIDMILITDEDGTTKFCNELSVLGYRFSEDPKEQSYAFRKLLRMKDGVVTQPTMKRSIDGKMYKFVGVSRSDKPGIIQVAFNAETIQSLSLQVGGFKVVANEVYLLAEKAKESAKSIEELIENLQENIVDINSAMNDSEKEVHAGLDLANHSGEVLEKILMGVEKVKDEATAASQATTAISESAKELAAAVESVSAVVEENTAATEQMSAGSAEITQAIENIASVSAVNSAAFEDVSASTEEMSAQVEEVTTSAQSLADLALQMQELMQQFKLN